MTVALTRVLATDVAAGDIADAANAGPMKRETTIPYRDMLLLLRFDQPKQHRLHPCRNHGISLNDRTSRFRICVIHRAGNSRSVVPF